MTEREFGPTGAYTLTDERVSDEAWRRISEIVGRKTGIKPPDEFRAALNDVLAVYRAVSFAAKDAATLNQLRRDLDAVHNSALDLMRRLKALDGNGRLLMSVGEPDGFTGMLDQVTVVVKASEAALEKAAQYRTGRPIDHAQRSMGVYLAEAVVAFLGPDKVTKTKDGLFDELFSVLYEEATGKPVGDPNTPARKALKAWEESRAILPKIWGGSS
ncbi:hypothetical protein [uncultured Ferrovibrio sp.]|jgi:hypothetical protein|uniref:hypothetical protein n=1 Tax=uncultured Ferrovibrio sp. TaxID=1576913 RepID=UPI00260B540F|nr:hypothetical protein [uncultured Ferrovibrio sp.]